MNFNESEVIRIARKIQSPEARFEYLDQVCPNASTRDRIDSLVIKDVDDSILEEGPTLDGNAIDPMTEQDVTGIRIGPYTLLEPIGEGGMGTVFLAEQVDPVKRRVALKLIKSGNVIGEVIARFESERQALALMDHPNIAKFHDAGTTTDGNPYFVMEFVPGISVTRYCDAERSSINDRLILFRSICQAVSHAHQKGIIHRDLKPSNIMVTVVDGQPVPKIIDFGLAKATGPQLAFHPRQTNFGQVMGTLQYMSPEQTNGNSADIDTRSDIYALGAILYQLLVGSPPFEIQTINECALDEVLRMIREQDPQTPKQRFDSSETNSVIAGRRRIDVDRMKRLVKGDLEWIVMRSLEKQRSRRYQSVEAFSTDVQRFIDFRPVEARPPSLVYRTRKFLRRNRASVSVVSGILLTAVVGFVIASTIVHRTRIAAQAQGLVDSLLSADAVEVPRIIKQLDAYPSWTTTDLKNAFDTRSADSNAKLYAALALFGDNESTLGFLKQRLLNVSADQFSIVRDSLFPCRNQLLDEYWSIAMDPRRDPSQRFQAAAALASFDSENSNWNHPTFSQFLADHLVDVLPSELLPWCQVFRPIKKNLIGPLAQIYRDKNRLEKTRVFAAVTLGDYLDENVESLFDLLADAERWQFPILFRKLEKHRRRAIELGNAEVGLAPESTSTVLERERLNIRRANAAVMLCRLGATELVWPVFAASPDPGARSYLIHWMSPLGVEPGLLIDRFNMEADVTIKRALLQCLGQFDRIRIPESVQTQLFDQLVAIYRSEHDSGLHSTAQWLLGTWDQADRLTPINKTLRQNEAQLQSEGVQQRQWFINSQGQTFAVIDAKEFDMGSPETEPGRRPDESLHHRKINRRIAIATTSVTLSQWRNFSTSLGLDETSQLQYRPESESEEAPVTAISWYDAVAYCNWLSQHEGIDQEQWCYVPNQHGEFAQGMRAKDRFWELEGYRLPTESEWEYACRAGSSTSRFFGQSDSLMSNYAWYTANALGKLRPVGVLKPNGFGLFDVLGNSWEWCYDSYELYPHDPVIAYKDLPSTNVIDESEVHTMHGGGYYSQALNLRSSIRTYAQPGDYRNFNVGIRPTRTFESIK